MRKKIKVVAVIPARMESTRLPGKPLKEICGLPMIEHVRRRVEMADFIDETIVATCNHEIFAAINGKVLMTSPEHPVCIDRVAEVVAQIEIGDLFILVQGDEPFVTPNMLNLLCEAMEACPQVCMNLMVPFTTQREFENENNIKVVVDNTSKALYMTRSPIANKKAVYKQLGLMIMQRRFFSYWRSTRSRLELAEQSDLLRAIENRIPIHMVLVNDYDYTVGVDTQEDLEQARELMAIDELWEAGY